jgi:signal transduction histidine kinase
MSYWEGRWDEPLPSASRVNPAILLSVVTLSLQVAALVIALMIGRAPGWRRVRIVALLAGSAGLYSLSSLLGWVFEHSPEVVWTVANTNFIFVGIHVSAWLWFSHADTRGSWRDLPRWVKRTVLGTITLTTAIGASGLAHDLSSFAIVRVDSLGYEFGRVTFAPVGTAGAALVLVVLLLAMARQVAEVRRGTPGSRAVVAGFVVLLLLGVEEALVAADVIDFMFLAEVGYLALVTPVVAQLVSRFVADARRLEVLSEWLAAEVETATHERDDARHALDTQRRFAAIGRIAGGIGHEVNNPLQVLTLNLAELQEADLDAAGAHAKGAVRAAVEATDRIQRVLAAVRAYARPLTMAPVPVVLREVVEQAVAEVRALGRVMPAMRVTHDPAPSVRGDPDRLRELVVAAIANATKALAHRGEFGEIRVRTGSNPAKEAVLEVADNGRGFPAHAVEHLADYLTGSREAAGASGLGLFVARSVVEAHGGGLDLARSEAGGALLRVRLPAADQAIAVASISTSAPGSIRPAT